MIRYEFTDHWGRKRVHIIMDDDMINAIPKSFRGPRAEGYCGFGWAGALRVRLAPDSRFFVHRDTDHSLNLWWFRGEIPEDRVVSVDWGYSNVGGEIYERADMVGEIMGGTFQCHPRDPKNRENEMDMALEAMPRRDCRNQNKEWTAVGPAIGIAN